MIYIDPAPNESGAYPNPKMQPFPGCIPLDAEQSQTFLDSNGFVTVQRIEDEETGEVGVLVTPNTEAWKAWKSTQPNPLDSIRESKLTELSTACNAAINAGTQVQLTDGSTESFTYSLADQSNISEMFNAVLLGATEYPYHANDDGCRMYSAQDIVAIYTTLSAFKTAQTTYHNQLKRHVKAMEGITEVEAVTYGQELTGEYLEKYNTLIAQAQEQMQTVLSKMMG